MWPLIWILKARDFFSIVIGSLSGAVWPGLYSKLVSTYLEQAKRWEHNLSTASLWKDFLQCFFAGLLLVVFLTYCVIYNIFLDRRFQIYTPAFRLCASVDQYGFLWAQSCNPNSPLQSWHWLNDKQLRHENTEKCLDVSNGIGYQQKLCVKSCNMTRQSQQWDCNKFFFEVIKFAILRITVKLCLCSCLFTTFYLVKN